jgi:hypothetical protein
VGRLVAGESCRWGQLSGEAEAEVLVMLRVNFFAAVLGIQHLLQLAVVHLAAGEVDAPVGTDVPCRQNL